MTLRRPLAGAVVGLALLTACGGGDDTDPAETGDPPTTTTTAEAATETTAAPAGSSSSSSSSTSTPENDDSAGASEAAESFLERYFPGTTATLSAFRQGDGRSGEIDVLRPSEGGGTANVSSTLLVRLDERDDWQVIGAVSEFVTIDSPENGSDVDAGPVTVSGIGRGFEGSLTGRAFDVAGAPLGEVALAQGGAQAEALPYELEVDLTGASGDGYVIVNGGTGLEGDPGEFAAVRITIG